MQLRSGLAAVVSLTALTVPASATASAAGLVRIGAIANPPSTLAPGASFRERFTVTRGGTAPRAATLDFYLSRSVTAKPATGIKLGHASLTALRRKRSITAVARLTVPRTVRSASRYYLLGCVRSAHPAAARGAAKRVCRAARRRVTIAAASRGDGTFPSSIPTSLPGIRPKPRSVTPHLDNAHATTVTVTPGAGGTLSTTSADGTQYRLDVTKGAVLSPLQVTMTPLSSIGGLGMRGGLVGGVQMSPDGLQLLEPATLTIVPRAGAPTANLTPFVHEGNGSNLGLVPPHPGSGVSFEPTHFSGGGVGSATNADRSAQDGHAPAGTAEQFRQEAQRLSQAGERNGVLDLFNTYYTQILKPKLEAALEDETLAPAATVEASRRFARWRSSATTSPAPARRSCI